MDFEIGGIDLKGKAAWIALAVHAAFVILCIQNPQIPAWLLGSVLGFAR